MTKQPSSQFAGTATSANKPNGSRRPTPEPGKGLQASGHAQDFCEGCHAVSASGNASTDEFAAYTATGETRYEDVQCEACHGPGLAHVTNPDANAKPVASIMVGTELNNGCGECHQGSHHGFVDEWAQSRHGDAGHVNYRERDGCRSCHGARGVFEAWGIDAEYLEKDGTEPIGIVCAVCHDPHDAKNEGQLRFPVDVPNVDVNLCMKCHQKPGRTRSDRFVTRTTLSPGAAAAGSGRGLAAAELPVRGPADQGNAWFGSQSADYALRVT